MSDARSIQGIPSPIDPQLAEGQLLLSKHPSCEALLQMGLSAAVYEKVLLGLATKLFTVEELYSLTCKQTYQLLIDKKLLKNSRRYAFPKHYQPDTNSNGYTMNWRNFPTIPEFTLFNLNELRQKVAKETTAEKKENSADKPPSPTQ